MSAPKKRPEPRFEDDPNPTRQETIDHVSNALRQVRSQPSPISTEGKTHPVDEPRFVAGLLDLYLGPERAKREREDLTPPIFGRAYQLGLREQPR